MHTVSNNQIADILHLNDKNGLRPPYLFFFVLLLDQSPLYFQPAYFSTAI